MLAATSLTAGAQASQMVMKANAFDAFANVQMAKLEKPANLEAMQVAPSASNRSIADGVYYGRPNGVYYSCYTWGGTPAWLLPGMSPVTYKNGYTAPHQASWSLVGSNGAQDLSELTDVDNNLVMTWGINRYISSEDLVVVGDAPTIAVGNTEFTSPYLQAVANNFSDQMNCSPTNKFYYGYTGEGSGFGTGSVYENYLVSQLGESLKKIHGTIEFFEKPVAPMLVESFSLTFVSFQENPLNGKELTLNIYGYDAEGKLLREPKEVLTCKSVEVLGSATDNGKQYWQCIATFSKKTLNEFDEEVSEPFVIDYQYAAEIGGYSQEGVDVEFIFAEVEDAYEMLNNSSTSYSCEMSDGSFNYYYFGQGEVAIKLRIFANVFYDGVELLNSYKSVVVSDDGQTCLTDNPNLEEADKVNFVPFSSAAPFFAYDENGEVEGQNYDVVGLPDWLGVDGVADDPREQGGYSAIFFKAEPLPAGTEGRYATIYIVGRGGAKNAQPITVRQGSVTGIDTVIAEGDANAIYYNVSGQRVNNAKGLVISKTGKRIVK